MNIVEMFEKLLMKTIQFNVVKIIWFAFSEGLRLHFMDEVQGQNNL